MHETPTTKRKTKIITYQKMPPAQADGFNNALETNKDRFGPVISSDNDFGVPWQHRELLVSTLLSEGMMCHCTMMVVVVVVTHWCLHLACPQLCFHYSTSSRLHHSIEQ